MIFLQIFLASIILWVMFIAVCNFRAHLTHGHPPFIDAIIHLFSFVFIVIDVTFNLVYGTIVFMDLPREFTLTARLKRLLHDDPRWDWRKKLASFVCRKMIEPWDWNHCGLSRV